MLTNSGSKMEWRGTGHCNRGAERSKGPVEWIVPTALGLVLGLSFLAEGISKTKTGLQLIPTDPVKCVGSPADFKVKPD